MVNSEHIELPALHNRTHLTFDYNENPNRWLNIPLLSIIFKYFVTLPQIIFSGLLFIVLLILNPINSLYVLFTGKLYTPYYNLFTYIVTIGVKTMAFHDGLIDSYPNFSNILPVSIHLSIHKNTKPNQLYAFPILSFFIRIILAIPYTFWFSLIAGGAAFAVSFGRLSALFTGKNPHAFQELVQDYQMLNVKLMSFVFGFDDMYPSFHIQKTFIEIKIFLIALGIIFFIIPAVEPDKNSDDTFDKPAVKNHNNSPSSYKN